MFDNYIRAFYKRHGITHPDQHLTETFEEVMLDELKIAEWIQNRGRDFLHRVLDRAAEKTAKAPQAKAPKPHTPKSFTPTAVTSSLPPKPMGGI